MSRRPPLVFLAWLVAALLLVVTRARADRPEITAQLDTDIVGEGDEIHLTLKVFSDRGAPTSPSPGATPGFTVVGSSSGPSQSVVFMNGKVSKKDGLTATWALRANKQGTFSIGPPSVDIAGTRYAAQAVRVQVVAPGQAPQPRGNPFDPFGGLGGFGSPFDPFGGMFPQFGGRPQPIEPDQPPTDPKLALDAPRGQYAFLHATIDKARAVVGEQVTLRVYIYIDPSEREANMNDVHEATADDFVKRSLVEDDAIDKSVLHASVGGRVWAVKLLRKWALFPLKTGDLEIGPMTLTLARRRITDPDRRSETLRVAVGEPPLAGRPPGYVVGDTGNFSLAAETTPREIERDGAVGVTVELSGTGNVPSSLNPPARAGIEWLTPEVHEKMGATAQDRYGGKRTFAFVVRLHKEGAIDLGDLTLPYYNPDTHAYAVARASLGVVNVKPGATPAPAAAATVDPFASLPGPRTQLAGARPEARHYTDGAAYWLALPASPLAFFGVTGIVALVKGVRRARADKAASPETDLKVRLAAAAQACRGNDPRAADAAVARALFAATVAKVGVNVRDAEGPEVSRRLASAGVDEDLARQIEGLIRDCEAARFAPDAVEMSAVRERWKSAQGAMGALRRSA